MSSQRPEAIVYRGEVYRNGTLHQERIGAFSRELVEGSFAAVEAAFKRDIREFRENEGREPTDNEMETMLGKHEYGRAWGLGPSGASSNMHNAEVVTPSEFIQGIAVSCGKEASRADIDTAIFFIGKHMAKLELELG